MPNYFALQIMTTNEHLQAKVNKDKNNGLLIYFSIKNSHLRARQTILNVTFTSPFIIFWLQLLHVAREVGDTSIPFAAGGPATAPVARPLLSTYFLIFC